MGREIIVIFFKIITFVTLINLLSCNSNVDKIQESTITVISKYNGASPEIIEHEISIPLGEGLSSISGVEKISSRSVQDSSVIIIQFKKDMDLDLAKIRVNEIVEKSILKLPKGIELPVISKVEPIHFCIKIDVQGSDDLEVLSSKAKDLINELYKTEGIKFVEAKGNTLQPSLNIEMDMRKLSALGISPSEVTSALKNASEVKDYNSGILIRIKPEIKNPEDYSNIVIAVKNDQPIYIKDVATIEMKQEVKEILRENNQRVINIYVKLTEEANLKNIHLKIESIVAEVLKTSPAGLFYKVSDLH